MKKTKKNIRTAKRWAFPIVAGAFAILHVTKGVLEYLDYIRKED